jgi:hypothetical protein
MLSACLCISPAVNFWMAEQIFMKLGMYIMATEPISTAYFINASRQSVSVCISLLSLQGNGSFKSSPPFGARQRLGKQVPSATNIRNNRIVGPVLFYAVRVLSKESVWVSLCLPLSLLGKNSVKTFPPERRIIGAVVFYAVLVVSKESRRLVLLRTSC